MTPPPASPPLDAARREAALARLETVALLMDDAWVIPGTRVKVGLDAAIGLIPGVGDVATALVALYGLIEAIRAGASTGLLLRMAGNIALDAVLGSLPVVGDLFDIWWRANRRNLALLRRHLGQAGP